MGYNFEGRKRTVGRILSGNFRLIWSYINFFKENSKEEKIRVWAPFKK